MERYWNGMQLAKSAATSTSASTPTTTMPHNSRLLDSFNICHQAHTNMPYDAGWRAEMRKYLDNPVEGVKNQEIDVILWWQVSQCP